MTAVVSAALWKLIEPRRRRLCRHAKWRVTINNSQLQRRCTIALPKSCRSPLHVASASPHADDRGSLARRPRSPSDSGTNCRVWVRAVVFVEQGEHGTRTRADSRRAFVARSNQVASPAHQSHMPPCRWRQINERSIIGGLTFRVRDQNQTRRPLTNVERKWGLWGGEI